MALNRFVFLLISMFSVSSASSSNYATCKIYGQLGNQMFQTAATIAYALDHGMQASFPTLGDAINGQLNCRDVFHRLNISPFPENTHFYFHDHNLISIVNNVPTYVPIPDLGNQNVCLNAHFCSEKYFIKHASEIRRLFAPTQEMIDRIRQKYGALFNRPTVAVHVRTFRPDGFEHLLNIPEQEFQWYYFINAMNQFPSTQQFLVFSDDMAWTKANFPSEGREITFIEGNSHTFDFYMISLCDHQIVSHDSTYSWWAAWLNENPEKIVIIPDRAGGVKNSYLLPEGWLKMPLVPEGT